MFAVNRWNPFDELATLHHDLDRMFGRQFGDAGPRRVEQAWTPPIEVASREDAWHVRVALPGVDPKTVRVDLHGSTLKIAGERPTPGDTQGESYHSELAYGPFERSFTLPSHVDGAKVSAVHNYGMLELTLPIAESAKPRRIDVGGGTLKEIETKRLA